MKCVVVMMFWAELSEVAELDPDQAVDTLENGLLDTFGEEAAFQLEKWEPFALVVPLRAVVEPIVGGVCVDWDSQRREERRLVSSGSRAARRLRSWERRIP